MSLEINWNPYTKLNVASLPIWTHFEYKPQPQLSLHIERDYLANNTRPYKIQCWQKQPKLIY